MDAHVKEGFARLLVGLAFNVALWFVFRKLGMWSGLEREFHLALIGGCIAAVAVVFILPVFWKGAAWQAPIAFVLLSLPVIVFILVFQVLLQHR